MVFPGVDGAFSYRIPAALQKAAAPGLRVLAPFGSRRLTGILIRVAVEPDQKATREIECLLDATPAFSAILLRFAAWIADYYLCPLGDVLKAALPAGIALDERKHWSLLLPPEAPAVLAFAEEYTAARAVIAALQAAPLTAAQMRLRCGLQTTAALLRRMRTAGLIDYRALLRPPRVKARQDAAVTLSPLGRELVDEGGVERLRSVHEQQLLREIYGSGTDGILRAELLRGANSGRRRAYAKLLAAGNFNLEYAEVSRWDPAAETIPETREPERLTAAQEAAIAEISAACAAGTHRVFLLHGVTGSGKTQVYIEAIRRVLAEGKTALVLLPEIALTPFVWGRFYRAFGDRVAIQHSAQSPAVRFDLWRAIQAGRYPVVVGARSAVFAPLSNLGVVVIDEEQEPSFKQEDPVPRYHGRDAALVRARMENAVAVLGSATPAVESLHHALTGRYRLLSLPERVGGASMPDVRLAARVFPPVPEAEMLDSISAAKDDRRSRDDLPLFTDELRTLMRQTLDDGKQILLLQNRRGYSPFLICAACGKIPACADCSVSLTYHRRGLALRCHYCDHREPAPHWCPKCGAAEWRMPGCGTQRLEEELAREFPAARVLRMDSDTTARQGAHGRMIADFAAGNYDVLVGTQMVAKGLDFPNVRLAAVVQADAEFFYPDFRATERAAGLILQVAGRAGRRAETGAVIVQSAVLEHPALQAAMNGDWLAFAQTELPQRQLGGFPPFSRLIVLRALGVEESRTVKALLRLRRLLQKQNAVSVLGPAPALVTRIKKLYRYHLLVRTRRVNDPAGALLRTTVRDALREYRTTAKETGVKIDVDVDPQTVV